MSKQVHIEETLISLLKARDKRAIEEIYARYGANLLGVIEKIVKDRAIAEDVLQDSFVKIWKKSESYDSSKGRLFTWMINICRNSAIDKIRSSGYKHMLKIQSEGNPVSMSESHSYSFNIDQIGVREWVNKLKPDYLEVIETVYFKGYSHSEAAKKLELPLGTLKTRLRSAMKELRRLTVP